MITEGSSYFNDLPIVCNVRLRVPYLGLRRTVCIDLVINPWRSGASRGEGRGHEAEVRGGRTRIR